MTFRKLHADEIDARVATVNENGCSLLLYKDARVDQNILDETVGSENWQRCHEVIGGNLYCSVSIWDKDKCQWISKQDVGTESYTEKEKGQASDSFKRACFNWGIGRELYTAPFIWINKGNVQISEKNGKATTNDRFKVKEIGYDEKGNISSLQIYNTKSNRLVYKFKNGEEEKPQKEEKTKKDLMILRNLVKEKGYTIEELFNKPLEELTEEEYSQALKTLSKLGNKQ